MKSKFLPAICFAVCITSSFLTPGNYVAAETTENDINAEDLSRDLERHRQDIEAAASIPSTANEEESNTAAEEKELPPWFKVEIIIFKQDIDTVTEEFPETVNFDTPSPLIMLKGYDYTDRHSLQIQNHGLEYTSLNNIPGLHSGATTNDLSTQDKPESALRNDAEKQSQTMPLSAYRQEELERLKDAYSRLEKSQNHQILLATAWKQPTLPKQDSPTLHLVAGNWFDDQPEFEAFLKVSKQRYLHAYADLFLKTFSLKSNQPIDLDLSNELLQDSSLTNQETEEENSFGAQGIQPHHFKLFSLNVDDAVLEPEDEHSSTYVTNEVFHIKEDRIMKHSKDLYFLDHPKFGMIIKITPLDQL